MKVILTEDEKFRRYQGLADNDWSPQRASVALELGINAIHSTRARYDDWAKEHGFNPPPRRKFIRTGKVVKKSRAAVPARIEVNDFLKLINPQEDEETNTNRFKLAALAMQQHTELTSQIIEILKEKK